MKCGLGVITDPLELLGCGFSGDKKGRDRDDNTLFIKNNVEKNGEKGDQEEEVLRIFLVDPSLLLPSSWNPGGASHRA